MPGRGGLDSVDVVRVVRDDDRSASASAKREREGFEDVLGLIRKGGIDFLMEGVVPGGA